MAKSPRVTNVQVPGEDPKKPEDTGTTTSTDSKATDTGAGSPPTPGENGTAQPPEGAGATEGTESGAGQTFDIEALRAQIRAEEMAKLQDELAQQLHAASQAASTVLAKPDAAAPARSKSDYRKMRAADVDPATLIAPVLTLDGYVCPVAPEKK